MIGGGYIAEDCFFFFVSKFSMINDLKKKKKNKYIKKLFNLLTKKNRGKKTTKLFFFLSSSSFSSFHFILVFCLCLRLSPLYLGFNFVFYCNTFPSSYFFFQFFNFIFFPSLSSSLPSFFSVVINQIETVTAKLLLYVSVILV